MASMGKYLQNPKMEGSCMDLALEGERLCKGGDCRLGVRFFEAAVQVGTDDLQTLSAIYSQMGNAYFYLQDYAKALEYHKHDLNLARTIGDRLGEAKASGNLGNTLKVLCKFDEAIVCCQRHLDISTELGDQIGRARALYNLGNVYHAKGKNAGKHANEDPGEFPPDVKESLEKAANYYEQNLHLVRDLNDRAAQGRACGNLGNTHYLLGNFNMAITYHEERLTIAREFGDRSAERRAYSNLGNAHIFLGQFDVASNHYKLADHSSFHSLAVFSLLRRTLLIARQLSDRALEAQACYSLGNTYTLLRDYDTAIEYHLMHLRIAQELHDRVGEGRACWSLGNAHTSLGNHQKALQYAKRHLEISKEIGDSTGHLTAEMNLADLKGILGISSDSLASDQSSVHTAVSALSDVSLPDEIDLGIRRPSNSNRRRSMDNLVAMTTEKQMNGLHSASEVNGTRPKHHRVQKAATVGSNLNEKLCRPDANHRAQSAPQQRSECHEEEDFLDLLSRFQSRRIDDQRCSFREEDRDKENKAANTAQAEEFLDMVAGIQGSRMNDQRALLPEFPGLNNREAVIGQFIHNRRDDQQLDDGFYEMLMRCQGSRIDDQRTELPEQSAPTVPDQDLFNLVQKMQSSRMNEQRTSLPKKRSASKKEKKKK